MSVEIELQITKSRLALKKNKDATGYLREAIKMHEGHMNGSIPTSDKSQEEMMKLMKQALSQLVDG